MWWRAGMMVAILVGFLGGCFFGIGPVTRSLWEDHVLFQLRDQPSFKPQESPVLDLPQHSVPMSRPGSVVVSAATGREIFRVKCAHCHGESGRGDGPVGKKFLAKVGDLTSPSVRAQTDNELFDTVAHGKRIMRGFSAELEDDEIWCVVKFLRTLP